MHHFEVVFLALDRFCRCKIFLQSEIFNRPFFPVFFMSNIFYKIKNVHQHSDLLRNAEPRRCGPCKVKNGGKK